MTMNHIKSSETSVSYTEHTKNIKVHFRTSIFLKNPYFLKLDNVVLNRRLIALFVHWYYKCQLPIRGYASGRE